MGPDILRCEFQSDTKSLNNLNKSRHQLLIMFSPGAQIPLRLVIWTQHLLLLKCAWKSSLALRIKVIRNVWPVATGWNEESTSLMFLKTFWFYFFPDSFRWMLDQTSFVAEIVLEKYSWTENRKYLQKQIHKPVTMQIQLRNYLKYHAEDPSLLLPKELKESTLHWHNSSPRQKV